MFNQHICSGQGMGITPSIFTLRFNAVVKLYQMLDKWLDNNSTKAILIVTEIYSQIQNFSFM